MDQVLATIAANFLKNDYPTTIDMAKSFLTLISGILVFSITFSEKIVDYTKADGETKRILYRSWISFILSILLIGGALCVLFLASFCASHAVDGGLPPEVAEMFVSLATIGWAMMFLSGLTFVWGLMLLLRSARRKHTYNYGPLDGV